MSSNNEIRDKIKVDRATANSDGCKFQKREEKKPKNGKQKKKNPRVNLSTLYPGAPGNFGVIPLGVPTAVAKNCF